MSDESELDYGFRPHENASRPTAAIENAFFPNLTVAELTKLYGVPNALMDEQVQHVLLIAMDRINENKAVKAWRDEKEKNGAQSLRDVGRNYGELNTAEEQYKRAVYASAKADLLRDHIAIDRKSNAETQAANSEEMVSHYERQSTRALAELIEQRSIGVYLT